MNDLVDGVRVDELFEVLLVDLHELVHLLLGPIEVLRGEGVEGQCVDAEVEAPLHELTYFIGPLLVALPRDERPL
jgi:hypothetical protein